MFLHRLALFFVSAVAVASAQSTVPTVTRAVPDQTLAPGGSAVTLDLSNYIGLPGAPGQIVRFDTVMGKFDVALRADVAPLEVANFLSYVQGAAGANYTNSFIHRSASLEPSGAISVVQGGGFYVDGSNNVATIATHAPVPLEYNLPNIRGSIAAARSADINSATSQWYINVRDDSTILGPANGGGYTVFGQVVGSGMTVVDAIAALPRVNAQPFPELPVRNYTSGAVQVPANLVMVNSITAVPTYPGGNGDSALTFSLQNSTPGVVTASVSGSSLVLTPVAVGNATVTVHTVDVSGDAVDATFAISVAAVMPSIVNQPSSQTVATGDTVVFNVRANAATTYQWQLNGSNLSGATDASLLIRNTTAANAGAYTVVVKNSLGSVMSGAATLTLSNPAPVDVGRLINLSIRSNAGTGDQTLIVGFETGGSGASGSMPLLLRGVGPSLAQFGLSATLADPIATLFSGDNAIATNDNWGGDPVVSAWSNQVGAFQLTSSSSLDAALAVTPALGGYTMHVTGNGGATGTALAEIYDATANSVFSASSPRLVNLSARSQVGTGDNLLIAGFAIRGSTSRTVLIRATGPALTNFGVSDPLADPLLQLNLVGNPTPIAVNDNWGGDPEIAATAQSVGAFPLTDGSSKDAALLVTLPPGNYTAQVSGVGGGTGIALIEVYEVR